MKYEKIDEVEREKDGREGVIVESPYLANAKKSNPKVFHDLRAVKWSDTGNIGWVNRDLLAIKD